MDMTDDQRRYFEADEKNRELIDQLTNELVSAGRGALIPWDRVESLAGGGRYTSPAQHIIRAAFGRLRRDFNMAVRVNRMVGVRLLSREESLRDGVQHRNRKMIRQSRMKSEEIGFDSAGMSNADRVLQQAQLEAAKRERTVVRQGSFLRRSTQTNPIRPIHAEGENRR